MKKEEDSWNGLDIMMDSVLDYLGISSELMIFTC